MPTADDGRHVAATVPAEEMSQRPQRDLAIETLRGLACILVVLYHVRGRQPDNGLRIDPSQPWSQFVDSFAYLRMPLFTFLSGAVYAFRPCRAGYGSFVAGKARRLLVPMLVIGTVFAFTQHFMDDKQGDPWYLWHLYPVGHYWFLESIAVVFGVVGVLDLYGLLDKLWVCVIASAALIVADSVVPVFRDLLGLRMALYLAPFFLVGLAATRFDWRNAPQLAKLGTAVAAAVLLTITQLGIHRILPRIPDRHSIIGGTLGVLACLALLAARPRSRLLAWLGGLSFTVYTCHVFGTAAARIVLHRAGIHSVTSHMIGGLAAGLAAGIGVELLARRSVLTRFALLGQALPRKRAVLT